jgi:RNA polymerase sigma-70 factor (ECF subfamily)
MDAIQRKHIEDLYIEMFDKLVVYARCNLSNDALAEEAVQETFRTACQKPELLCSSANPQGWLVLTLRNTIRNMKSHLATVERIMNRYLMSQCKEITFSEDRIHLQILYDNIADTEEFKLLSEMVFEGKSHKEMALSRGITISACKKRVQRAKQTLQRKIK